MVCIYKKIIYNLFHFVFVDIYTLEVFAWLFFTDPANFSDSRESGVQFPTVWNCPEKIENLILIKLVQKPKGADRKGHFSFFVLNFLNFNLVPIDSELNYGSGNQTYFYHRFGRGTQKSNQTWKCGLKFKKKNDFWYQKAQGGKVVKPNPLDIWHPRDCGINICLRSKSLKSNPIFHLKGRGDMVFPFTYLDSPMANFFWSFLVSLILAIFVGKKGGQSCTKHANFRYLLSLNLNFSKIL